MADSRFFASAGPFTLAELALIAAAEPRPAEALRRRFADVAPIATAGPDQVTFLDNPRYRPELAESRAGACILAPNTAFAAPNGMALLLTDEPYRAYARVAEAFHPETAAATGVDPDATIDPTARLGSGVSVGARAVVGPRAEIGARVRIGPGAILGEAVMVGAGSEIGAGVVLSHCIIGCRVLIHPGAAIGQRGFGFALDRRIHVKVPQLGRVVVEDDVEIGANTTIDRGAGPDTVIGAGTMIDNLVQIGHNVHIGRGCVVVAQVGVAGSAELGDHVMVGGQAGIAGHLRIGEGARIAARSAVMRDVAAGATVCGAPAQPVAEFWRGVALLRRLAARRGEGT
jgi:UDP-3-O-[3-hydroxymyristoyl] glucosamine N-acyltransferase